MIPRLFPAIKCICYSFWAFLQTEIEQISLPFHILTYHLQLVKFLPFYIPEYPVPTTGGASSYRPIQRIPPGGNHLFVSLTLQKTPKIVSAEVATVLRFSRFASHLEFQPLESGTSAPTDDVYRNVDPFAYCAANNVAKASGSCKPKVV